ncbi:MAG: DUF4345 family protein [Pirellulales bacterium]|nr:DUF4345 family protein [Pirellulales bacterium]
MVTRSILAIVGLIYWGLALWCAFSPQQTSRSLGFTLQPGNGQSEYLAVYGGLQIGLGAIFLWPLVQNSFTQPALWCCFLVHASIVVFRTIGFFAFSGIPTMTIGFAMSEWVLALGAAALLWWKEPGT